MHACRKDTCHRTGCPSKDRDKFEASGDDRNVDKAHRRGKIGWNVGRHIEVAPHYRRPHMALVWTGRGRAVPRVVPRRGSVVHRKFGGEGAEWVGKRRMTTKHGFDMDDYSEQILAVSPNTLCSWGASGKIHKYRHPLNNYRLFRQDDSYLLSKKVEFGMGREIDNSDFHVESIDLLNNGVEAQIGVAFFVAAFSALPHAPVTAATLILGDMSIQGNIKEVRSLTEPLQLARDNGGKRALVPIENKRRFLEVSGGIMEHVDSVFYGDPKAAAFKALGMN